MGFSGPVTKGRTAALANTSLIWILLHRLNAGVISTGSMPCSLHSFTVRISHKHFFLLSTRNVLTKRVLSTHHVLTLWNQCLSVLWDPTESRSARKHLGLSSDRENSDFVLFTQFNLYLRGWEPERYLPLSALLEADTQGREIKSWQYELLGNGTLQFLKLCYSCRCGCNFFFNRENATQSPCCRFCSWVSCVWRGGRSKRCKPHTTTTISHAEGGFLPGECNSCWWWFPVVCCEVQMEAFPETEALCMLPLCPRYRRLAALILQLAEWRAGVEASP